MTIEEAAERLDLYLGQDEVIVIVPVSNQFRAAIREDSTQETHIESGLSPTILAALVALAEKV